MNAAHHPSDAFLVDYAAGNTSPLFDTILRAHLGVCAHCRETLLFAEELGGELLSLSAIPGGTLSARDICARHERDPRAGPPISRVDGIALDGNIEQLVGTYLNSSIDALPWKRIGKGLRLCRLDERDDARMWMLRAEPGAVLPEHTHSGSELTLVLKGAYFCGSEIFRAGDIEDADEQTEHQPVVTREAECICLAVTEGNLKFNGWLPRLVQPFIGI